MMNIKNMLGLALTMTTFNAYADDHCNDLSAAVELSTFCNSASGVCSLNAGSTYKITQDTGSLATPLLPVKIPATSTLCVVNNATPAPINIVAQSFWVDGGVFQIGSLEDPIKSTNKVTITMTGTASAAAAPMPLCQNDQNQCSEIAKNTIATQNARDITVSAGGQLLFYGAKGLTKRVDGSYIHSINHSNGTADGQPLSPTAGGNIISGDINQVPYFNNVIGSNSWTYLTYPAGPSFYNADMWVQAPVSLTNYGELKNITTGSSTNIPTPVLEDTPYMIALAKRVTPENGTDWQSGDWISISTTSFVSHETEIVQICAIYDMQNPDSNAQSESRYMQYGNVSGSSNYPNISVIVLAGSPSFKSQCPSISNDTPLKHYHFGSLPPTPGFFSADTPSYKGKYNAKKGQANSMYDDAIRNFGIDERAEVALLSRNIKLTSTAGVTSSPQITHLNDAYFGGHIAVMNHSMSDHKGHSHGAMQAAVSAPDVTVQLVGVEIEKFGQPLVGRYPVHFHRLNADSLTEDNQLLVQDVSVHHSFNKCFVTHDTMGVKFYNNSCVRTIGQAFYLEDGHNIADNQYVRNLVQGAMAAALKYDEKSKNVVDVNNNPIGKNTFWDGDYLVATGAIDYNPEGVPDTSDSGANTGNFVDSFAPSGFWITTFGRQSATNANLPNLFVNNSVAGCQIQGAAYWFVRQDVNSMGQVGSTPEADLYPVFTGNRGHACYDGVMAGTNFFVMKATKMGAPPKPVPVGSEVNTSANAPLVIFDSLTLTQIQQKAFWYRGAFVAVNNSRFSMLKQGMTLLRGGGPEGNLLGFFGLVNNSVFAGVTNNNVGRYVDCEEYYKLYSSGTIKLATTDALPVAIENETGQCVPVNPNDISQSKANTNMQTATGDIHLNYNFQGYTFYDGPARMENNRFVNFRADPTNSALYDNNTESYSTSESRYLVTKIDAHRMMNFNKTGQLSAPTGGNNYTSGGNDHYGYNGDVAFSWLKGNAQSVPPTQYAKNNLWDNVNFQHQVFTEISNLNNGLDDGDKQTVEIDKDASLSGYKVCSSKTPSSCSNAGLNHYPISLNNLEYFSTDYTVDEPHSRGRNNATASALMSPHQYASINVVYNASDRITKAGVYPLSIVRDMAYQANSSEASYTGRGGKNYMFEAMVMNNMGYTFDSQLTQQMKNDQVVSSSNKLIFSYSDAPVHSTFINRVGICIGKNATNIEIYKVPRQWNSLVTYLTKSPYWNGYGLTATGESCPNSIDKPDSAYDKCKSTAGGLSSPWGAVSAYTYDNKQADGYKELNKQFAKGMTANYNLAPSTSADLTEGYYYDSSSGILYFNMIQYAASSTLANPITPPFATCDKSNYNTTSIDALLNYLTFSNPDAIKDILTTACYAESGTPITSELLTCPPEGCAVYTVGFDVASASEPSCTPSAWAMIKNGSSPSFNTADSTVTYSSPYLLYNAASNTQVTPQNMNVKAQGSISTLTRYYNIDPSITAVVAQTEVNNLLPLASAASNGQTYIYNATPSGISIVSYPNGGGSGGSGGDSGTVWTFNTGADATAGQEATITAANGKHFYNTNENDKKIVSYTIEPTTSGSNFSFKYGGVDKTAMVTLPNEPQGQQTCSLTFNQGSNGKVTKGTEAGCVKITIPINGVTITVSH